MIAEAAGRLGSFADAAFALGLAGVPISARHVQRVASEVGAEMARQRDEKVARRRRRELPVRVAAAPGAVAVEIDGGRLRTREAGAGPGVHGQQNKEDKVACLVSLHGEAHQHDPQPEPPESFLEPRRVQRLVQAMKGQAGDKPQDDTPQEDTEEAGRAEPEAEAEAAAGAGPKSHVRTCVASMAGSDAFGPMVAAEAQERGFYQARRRAFLADGAAYNWSIQRGYFPDFEPIADMLHVLCYVYLAARAVGLDEAQGWSIYEGWLRACWQGRVKEVIEALQGWQAKLGDPPRGPERDGKDPRVPVAEALSYLGNNQARMDYPRYRKESLPITSSLAESLVGEVNARVKGRDKYWNLAEGAEAILQLRAAVLSQDGRLGRFFEQRPGCAYRRRKAA